MIGNHEDAVASNSHATVDAARGHANQALRSRALVLPDLPAAARIERVAFVGIGDVHDTFHNHRCDFEQRHAGRRECPFGRQAPYVALIDLVESAVAVAAHVSVVSRPVDL